MDVVGFYWSKTFHQSGVSGKMATGRERIAAVNDYVGDGIVQCIDRQQRYEEHGNTLSWIQDLHLHQCGNPSVMDSGGSVNLHLYSLPINVPLIIGCYFEPCCHRIHLLVLKAKVKGQYLYYPWGKQFALQTGEETWLSLGIKYNIKFLICHSPLGRGQLPQDRLMMRWHDSYSGQQSILSFSHLQGLIARLVLYIKAKRTGSEANSKQDADNGMVTSRENCLTAGPARSWLHWDILKGS